jgi:hypothetical protein
MTGEQQRKKKLHAYSFMLKYKGYMYLIYLSYLYIVDVQ